jgi:DegT/DnrJ/EryC1/StrS aminotransferase family
VRKDFLAFGTPDVGQPEIDEVVDSLRSGWIGTGPKVERFERMLEDYVGHGHLRQDRELASQPYAQRGGRGGCGRCAPPGPGQLGAVPSEVRWGLIVVTYYSRNPVDVTSLFVPITTCLLEIAMMRRTSVGLRQCFTLVPRRRSQTLRRHIWV